MPVKPVSQTTGPLRRGGGGGRQRQPLAMPGMPRPSFPQTPPPPGMPSPPGRAPGAMLSRLADRMQQMRIFKAQMDEREEERKERKRGTVLNLYNQGKVKRAAEDDFFRRELATMAAEQAAKAGATGEFPEKWAAAYTRMTDVLGDRVRIGAEQDLRVIEAYQSGDDEALKAATTYLGQESKAAQRGDLLHPDGSVNQSAVTEAGGIETLRDLHLAHLRNAAQSGMKAKNERNRLERMALEGAARAENTVTLYGYLLGSGTTPEAMSAGLANFARAALDEARQGTAGQMGPPFTPDSSRDRMSRIGRRLAAEGGDPPGLALEPGALVDQILEDGLAADHHGAVAMELLIHNGLLEVLTGAITGTPPGELVLDVETGKDGEPIQVRANIDKETLALIRRITPSERQALRIIADDYRNLAAALKFTNAVRASQTRFAINGDAGDLMQLYDDFEDQTGKPPTSNEYYSMAVSYYADKEQAREAHGFLQAAMPIVQKAWKTLESQQTVVAPAPSGPAPPLPPRPSRPAPTPAMGPPAPAQQLPFPPQARAGRGI